MLRTHYSRIFSGVALLFSLSLAGCGGGDGGSNSGGTPSGPVTPSQVSGTVASGAPVAGASLVLTDSTGKQQTATAGADGSYTISVAGLTGPFSVVATDPSGATLPLVAVIDSLRTGSSSATLNVTSLTTAVAALLTSDGNALKLATGSFAATVTSSSVQNATAALKAALQAIAQKAGFDLTTYNPMTSPFVANHAGQDAVIDSVHLVQTNGSALQLTSQADSAGASQALVLPLTSASVNNPPVLTPPPALASEFTALQQLMQKCLAVATANRGSAPACQAVMDPSFLANGYTDLSQYNSDLALPESVGATVGAPVPLLYYTNPATNAQQVMLKIPYTLSNGVPASFIVDALKLAQPKSATLPDGTYTVSWNLYGNQRKYDASIRTFVSRRTYFDPTSTSRYESGLHVFFDPTGPNASSVNAVNVTGPGLPSNGVYLTKSSACGTSRYMAIPGVVYSAPPTVAVTTKSDTNLFRYHWQASMPGQTFTPPSRPWYASSPVASAGIPLFAAYTFKLYDGTGTQIDTFTVRNPSPAAAAPMASDTSLWNQLLNTSDFLSPTGKYAAAQSSVPFNWTVNPTAPQVKRLGVFTGSSGSTTATIQEVDGFQTVVPGQAQPVTVMPSTATANNASQCTGAQFNPQITGYFRLVQLRATNANGIALFDLYGYNN